MKLSICASGLHIRNECSYVAYCRVSSVLTGFIFSLCPNVVASTHLTQLHHLCEDSLVRKDVARSVTAPSNTKDQPRSPLENG